MSSAEKIVKSCSDAMMSGAVSYYHIRRIIRYKKIDVTSIEKYLYSDNRDIRDAAVQIIGAKGNVEKLVDILLNEDDRIIIMRIIDSFGRHPEKVDKLVELLNSEDQVVFEKTIELFRKVGREDCLFGLLFSSDDSIVNRIKGYIDEQRTR